jgi:D-glycero-alpha-D-manno-heptose 1-phosphate guanylyltransferase
MDELLHITAGILAGGAGTRLRSVVADRPKVLAQVSGRPFVTFLLDQLAAQGIPRVVLCTGYMGDQVEASLGDQYRGMQLLYSREERALGTAGAIARALPLLTSATVLLLNGDSFYQANLPGSLAWHRQQRARATLVLAHLDNSERYGRVTVAADGRITGFNEKSGIPGAGWINSGIYWFDRAALAGLPQQQTLSLEREVLPSWIGHGLHGYAQRGRFLDIGVPDDYARAEAFFAELNGQPLELAVSK